MYCNNCGKEIPEGSAFCSNCGTPVSAHESPQPAPDYLEPGPASYQSPPDYQEPANYQNPAGYQDSGYYQAQGGQGSGSLGMPGGVSVNKTSRTTGSAREYITALATSYLFLASVICYSLLILASIFQTRNQSLLVSKIIGMITEYGGYGAYFGYDIGESTEMISSLLSTFLGGANVVGIIIKLAPTIVICVGLWFIYVQARSGFQTGTVGFVILKVMEWITLVWNIILVVVVTVILFIIAIKTRPIILLFALLYIAISFLGLYYYWKVIKAIDQTQTAIISDRPAVPISMYVIVMTFILAFTGLIGGIVSGGILSAMLQTAANVIFAILMIRFNTNMGTLIRGGMIEYEESKIDVKINSQQASSGYGPGPAGPGVYQGDGFRPQEPQYQPQAPQYQPQTPVDAADYHYPDTLQKEEEDHGYGTMILEDEEDNATTSIRAQIIDLNSGQEIPVVRTPFVIGKDPARADYAIENDPTVSRVHAQIVEKMGDYYLVDLNSTNHTYLNRIRIESEKEIPLSDGDEFTLARVRFAFQKLD